MTSLFQSTRLGLSIRLGPAIRLGLAALGLAALGLALVAPLPAGTFSTAPWTNDASSGIASGVTTWAYRFGSATNPTINGITVTAVLGPTASDANFDLNGTSRVFTTDDTNNVTGTGSTEVARRFVFNGNPATVMVKGLTAGTTYTVTFLSVGFEAAGGRQVTFTSGSDSRVIDQNQFGDNNGIRVDYTFTATAATRTITLAPVNAATWHFYGLALRQEVSPTHVTNTSDAGPGSLRWALANAADRAGADTITFAPALAGQTITLASGITVADTGGVTLDASALPGGLTLTDTGIVTYRLLSLTSGSLTLRGLTLRDGSGGAIFQSSGTTLALTDCSVIGNSTGGANGGGILSLGALTLTRCTFSGNSASPSGEGGAVRSENAAFTAIQCTFAGNTAKIGGACSLAGDGAVVLTHCTISGNRADSDPNNNGGGGLYFFNRGATLRNCLIAGNTSGFGGGTDLEADSSGPTPPSFTTQTNLIGSNKTVTSPFPAGSPNAQGNFVGSESALLAPGLAPLADNGGPVRTMALLPGSPALDAATVLTPALATDQRGLPRNRDGNATAGALPDIGAYEAQAAPVSLGFNLNGASPRNLAANELAGAPEFAQTHWNNLAGHSGGSTSPRTLSGGGSVTVRTDWDAPNVWAVNSGTPTTPHQKLMWGYLDSNGGENSGDDLYQQQNQPFFGLADLPAALTVGGYRVVVYADTDATDGRTGEYWLTSHASPANVGGTTRLSPSLFLKDNANFTGTYTRVPATSTARATAAEGNYLVFENQTQPGFMLRTEESPSPRGAINAVQVVRNELLVVTTAADELDPVGTPGTGLSLREAIALAPDGAGIVFDPAIFTGGAANTITLASALGEIVLAKSVTIDASQLATAITLDGGPGTNRIFSVNSGRTVALRNLTLTGGSGGGASANRSGGAIYNFGTLTLTQCTLSGNSANSFGGAISNGGTLTLTQCTLSGNSASNGGAIYNSFGTLTLTQCALSGNSASNGSAIWNSGTLTLTQCTLSGNSPSNGGAIYNSRTLTIRNTIVAGNTAFSGVDIRNLNNGLTPIYARIGANLVQHVANTGTVTQSGPITISAPPLLAPLGNYGGPTLTMPLLPGSPARNAAVGSTITTDQRGFPIFGTPDIGAYEAQIGPIAAVNTPEGVTTAPLPFEVGQVGTLTATSSVPGLVSNLSLGGSGANRTLTITPFPGQTGTATITITDSLSGETSAFELTVVPFVAPVVSSAADSGPGSLRQAIADAAAHAGPDAITFAPALSGQTITLASEIVMNMTNAGDVTIDATSLANGLTLSGGGTSRLFSISKTGSTFGTVTLAGLTLTGGNGTGASPTSGGGGAILNSGGTLTLMHCTLSGNSASLQGGAIYNASGSTLTLTHCTLSGNSTTQTINNDGGGAIYNLGTLAMTHCTFSANSSARDGGAIYNTFGSTLTLTNSIVAGNTAATTGPDLQNLGSITRSGVNLVGDLAGSGLSADTTLLSGNPRLAPLANNGGPTQTMALLPGSPALDAATVLSPALATDQRGLPRSRDGNATAGALPDIGAYEAQAAPVSLGFNFNGVSPRDLAASELAGAPEFAQTHWNNLAGDSGGSTGPRTLSGGGTVDVRTDWDSPNVWTVPGTTATPHQKLMRGYLDSNGVANSGGDLYQQQNQPFFGLADLPPALTLGGYRVVVYADTDTTDGRTGEYWLTSHASPGNVSGTTELSPRLFLKDNANFTATYTRVPATSTSGATAAAGNYLVFENQTQPGFILRAEEFSGPQLRAAINAVQVVRNELLVVTTAADELDPVGTPGTGLSLREAIALAPDGAGIVFDPAVFNGEPADTITLTLGSEMAVHRDITIDARNIPGGVTIDAGASTNRILFIATGHSVSLLSLTFTGGNGEGAGANGNGGAIFNSSLSTVSLTDCTLHNNSAYWNGGALVTDGDATLTRCTFYSNTSNSSGGAISAGAGLSLLHCTIINNAARGGGGINAWGTTSLRHCTIAGNTATNSGGGILNSFFDASRPGNLTITSTIIAGNTAPSPAAGPDIFKTSGTLTYAGGNLIGKNDTVATEFPAGPLVGTSASPVLAQLAPLGNYGGPTRTMALLPGSPARNAAVGSTITTDQRGFPIVGTPDIGAYEAGTFTDYDAWIWESLPTNASPAARAPAIDHDGDGRSNALEYAVLGDPSVPDGGLILPFTRNPAGTLATIVMPYRFSSPDLVYTIERGTGLTGAWTPIITVNSATNAYSFFVAGVAYSTNDNTSITFTDTFIAGKPKVFYRLKVNVSAP